MIRSLKNIPILLLFSIFLLLTACQDEAETSEAKKDSNEAIQVVTTIAQIGEPISVIGGEHIEVKSLMGPSVDPHLYNPTQSDMDKIAKADIIFYNGLNLEANMVDVFTSIANEKAVLAIGETISEDKLLKDEEGSIDPHIWFDIDLWQEALGEAVELLKEYAPEYADDFEANKKDYFAQLDELKEEVKKLAQIPEEQRILVTAHDAFGYFGRMHEMKVVGLQGLSTEDEVGISDINETIAMIKEHNVPAIFVESTINENSINAVIEGAASEGIEVELGGELYSDAMGEANTEEGTYIGMYRHNVETIFDALSKGAE